jgi:predicted acyl esterase
MAAWRAALLVGVLAPVLVAGCLHAPPEPASTPGQDRSGDASPPPDAASDPLAASAPAPAAPRGGGFSTTDVFPGDYDGRGNYSRVLQPGPHGVLAPEVVVLRSDADGAPIEMGLVRPDVPQGQRTPVLVVASPYFVPMTPRRITGEERVEGAFPHLWAHYEHLVPNFVPHGYTVALLATRGTANSGGCMDLWGPLEQADLDQAVTWLGTQDWSSGAVGMFGLSYSASTPWEVAARGNPHLRTIVAASGLPSFRHYLFYNGTVHGGAHAGFPGTYYALGFAGADAGRSPDNVLAGVACPALPPSLAAPSLAAVTLQDAAGFFAPREHRPGVLANWRGSVFLVQGLDDWRVAPKNAFPWAHELQASGIEVKGWLGQWGHAFPDARGAGEHRRIDFAENLLRWFAYWLEDDRSVDLGPRWQVEDSEGRWRSEEAWPPSDAQPLALVLGADGTLAPDGGAEGEVTLVPEAGRARGFLPLNPRLVGPLESLPATPCAACHTFTSEAFAHGLRIAGLPTVHLAVTPTGPGGHVTARLFAVGQEGPRLLGRGGIDLRVAEGGSEPAEVVVGEPLVARMTLEPLDAVVRPGERLAVVLDQGGYEERLYSLPTYPVTVRLGSGASVLTLPTFTRGEGAHFEPPRAAG